MGYMGRLAVGVVLWLQSGMHALRCVEPQNIAALPAEAGRCLFA